MHQSTVRLLLQVMVSAASLVALRVEAQPIRRIELKPPSATHPEEFTSVTSLRELPDGRLIVTDGREQRVVALDFRAGTAEAVGRGGRGPNEYSMVSFVHGVAADSSVMYDLGGQRYLVFAGSKIVVTVPPDHASMKSVGRGYIAGADALGNLLVRVDPARKNGVTETGLEDSASLVRVSRATGRADTIARTRNMPRRIEITRGADDRITASSSMVRGPLLTEEQGVIFSDGTLAVARIEPFRVDWRAPTGAWTRGAALPVPKIRVDARERDAWADRNRENMTPQALANLPEAMRRSMTPQASDFPEFISPFPSGSLRTGPAGLLLIRRTRSADITGNNYLVIDRRGLLLGEIVLPVERTIVGAGPNSIYITVKDEDDVLRIQRHPWP